MTSAPPTTQTTPDECFLERSVDVAGTRRGRWRPAAWLAALALAAGGLAAQGAGSPAPESAPPPAGRETGPARIMGLVRGDCKKCHPSEVAAWMKTTHFLSAETRLGTASENATRYTKTLGIAPSELMTTSLCADCHGTKALEGSQVAVVSGVSCEKCHGAAGGDDGWLNRHQSYHNTQVITRAEETPEHRQQRIADCDQAGMIRSANIDGLARACYSCHLVNNEELVAAGHKLASAFEFTSWSEGEIRHNFLVNRDVNAKAPTLWMERTGGDEASRRRLKYVVGALVQLEMGLRTRATTTSPVLIPQIGGMVAAANGRLAQIAGTTPIPEVTSATTLVAPMLGLLFAPQPGDEATYTQAADQVAALAEQFQENHTGEGLAALDALIGATPPHFSQQFRDKYLPAASR